MPNTEEVTRHRWLSRNLNVVSVTKKWKWKFHFILMSSDCNMRLVAATLDSADYNLRPLCSPPGGQEKRARGIFSPAVLCSAKK